jgi:TraX protein
MTLVAVEPQGVSARPSALPPMRLSDGTVEGLKWFGLLLMTLDHINKHLLHARATPLFDIGRLALPLFGLVLAYNLARPGALERGVYPRLLSRLAVVALIAEIPFIGLGGLAWGWYPFNILVMLLVAGSMIWLIDRGGGWRIVLAVVLFVVGGAFVEFWWPGIALCVAAWAYCRRPNAPALTMWIASTAALYMINRNYWALASFPLIFYAPHARWQVPRIRWAFYVYYPAHLFVLWAVALLVGK